MRNKTLILALAIMAAMAFSAWAAIPNQLHVQGRLLDSSGEPLDGSYNFTIQPIKIVGSTTIRMKEYIIPGVEVRHGNFFFEFGDEELKNADFSGGLIGYYLKVNTTNMTWPPNYQKIPCSPASFITFSILKGGAVEASGRGLMSIVNAANTRGSLPVGGLASYVISTTPPPKYMGAAGYLESFVYSVLGRYDTSKYSGIYAYSRGRGEDNIGFYGFSQDGTGIFSRGEVALKAENIGGGPALEVGPGIFQIPWSIIDIHRGPFLHHQIDIAPIEWDEYGAHAGAVGIVTFRHYWKGGYGWVSEEHFTVNNSLAKTDSAIFLSPRVGSAEAYIMNKRDGYFDVQLKEPLPRDGYAEFSFLIINRFTTED